MSPPRLNLADFLCFSIYSANLAFGKAYKPLLDQRGITYTQYIAIVALYDQDHQTVSGLGEKLFLESNTLTPILKKLKSLGYVTRRRDPDDERQVVVSLTEAGRELREQSFELELASATGLTVDEMRTMQKGIAKLRDNLREHVRATR